MYSSHFNSDLFIFIQMYSYINIYILYLARVQQECLPNQISAEDRQRAIVNM